MRIVCKEQFCEIMTVLAVCDDGVVWVLMEGGGETLHESLKMSVSWLVVAA